MIIPEGSLSLRLGSLTAKVKSIKVEDVFQIEHRLNMRSRREQRSSDCSSASSGMGYITTAWSRPGAQPFCGYAASPYYLASSRAVYPDRDALSMRLG